LPAAHTRAPQGPTPAEARVHAIATTLAQGLVVSAAAAFVGVALQGDARGRTVTQVLGVASHDGLEFRLHGVLVQIEVDNALAQASVGVQIARAVQAGGGRAGRLGGRTGINRRLRRHFLDLLRAASQRGYGQQRNEQNTSGLVHGYT